MENTASILVFTLLLTAYVPNNLGSPVNTPDSLGTDLETTCSVRAAQEGQKMKLTCDFKINVSEIDGKVYYYGWNHNVTGKLIFECYIDKAGKHCKSTDTLYRLQGDISDKITLLFEADTSMEGYYSCDIPGGLHRHQRCVFRLAPAAESRNDTITATYIGGALVGILLIALIVAIFVLRRKRKSRNSHGNTDGSESPTNRRRPGTFQRVCISCCTRSVKGNPHDASVTTPMVESPTETDHSTPLQQCIDSGIDSLQYPSYIERLTYSSSPFPAKVSIHTGTGVNSDNTLSSSAAQTILRPFVDAMEMLRREVIGPTPPTPNSGAAKYYCEPMEMSNVDRILKKSDSVSPDTAENVVEPKTRKALPKEEIESTEAPPASPEASEWPPIHKLQDQKVWIERRLLPYVSCTDFPRSSQEANRQLVELLMVQQSIQCRLADLKGLPTGRCSFDVSQLQDVIAKLEYAEKQVGTRQEALKELLNNLVKAEHVVHNYKHKMDRVSCPPE